MDTSNKFIVHPRHDGIRIGVTLHLAPDGQTLSRSDALNLAAWLVALAEPGSGIDFQKLLNEVRNT